MTSTDTRPSPLEQFKAIIATYELNPTFPESVLADAERAVLSHEAVLKDSTRMNLTDRTTFTIDPDDARDYDDALSYYVYPDGRREFGIHIADVSAYVTHGSPLDIEAQKRGTSVYLPGTVIPMLPEELSNDICSLRADVERATMSILITLAPDNTMVDLQLGRAVIRSNRRFTYSEVDTIFKNKGGEYYTELLALDTYAQKLKKERLETGSLILPMHEVRFKYDENQGLSVPYIKSATPATMLVEELMLKANTIVGEVLAKHMDKTHHLGGMFRVHDNPDADKYHTFRAFVKSLGFSIPKNSHTKGLQDFIDTIANTPLDEVIMPLLLRTLAKATYQATPSGHFGLGFTAYAHFTSPIRRYPDLIAHRLLMTIGEKQQYTKQQLSKIAEHATEREIIASKAERESTKQLQVIYMKTRIDEVWDVAITGIAESGMFVEEKTTRTSGFIAYRTLGGDYYGPNRTNTEARGKKTNTVYKLGDAFRAKITRINEERNQIDFEIVA